jgi:hypothetical protein
MMAEGPMALPIEPGSERSSRIWALVAMACMLAVFLGLRFGSGVLQSPERWDEPYITVPMFELMEQGWSVDTAIDFEETKGPGLIWPYALLGQAMGGSLNDLRLVSGLFFVVSVVPLLLLALRAGARARTLLYAVVGFALLPYEVVFGQLVMGEASFLFGALWLMLVAIWGFGDEHNPAHRVAGPIIYCIVLAMLLHSRIHAVAWAGAICLVAFQRDGIRSWPWWVASIVAGLLRIPLWIRWGGLVSPEYANLHGLGFRLEPIVYLGAALIPLTGVFLIIWFLRRKSCPLRMLCPLGACIGLIVSLIAMPDLTIPDTLDLSVMHDRYQGIMATAVTLLGGTGIARSILLGAACVIGFASLGALGSLAFGLATRGALASIVRMQFWVLCIGIGLYALTRGFVFDRFLIVWAVGLPVVWARLLPRWLLGIQLLALLLIAVKMSMTWLG